MNAKMKADYSGQLGAAELEKFVDEMNPGDRLAWWVGEFLDGEIAEECLKEAMDDYRRESVEAAKNSRSKLATR